MWTTLPGALFSGNTKCHRGRESGKASTCTDKKTLLRDGRRAKQLSVTAPGSSAGKRKQCQLPASCFSTPEQSELSVYHLYFTLEKTGLGRLSNKVKFTGGARELTPSQVRSPAPTNDSQPSPKLQFQEALIPSSELHLSRTHIVHKHM